MKRIRILILGLTLSQGAYAQKNVKSVNTTLKIQGIEVKLSIPPIEGDAGSFTRIDVYTKTPATFKANDAWDIIPTDFLRNNKNLASSKYIFAKAEKEYSLILLWGYAYPSGRDEVTIVSLTQTGAKLLHSGNIEEPVKFEDLDGDGLAELICRNEPEMISANTGVYSPYIVYSYTRSSFGINKALSEAYNKKHYIWAGLKYREDINVKEPDTKGGSFKILKKA